MRRREGARKVGVCPLQQQATRGGTRASLKPAVAVAALIRKKQIEGKRAQDKSPSSQPKLQRRGCLPLLSLLGATSPPQRSKGRASRRGGGGNPPPSSALQFFFGVGLLLRFFFSSQPASPPTHPPTPTSRRLRWASLSGKQNVSTQCVRTADDEEEGEGRTLAPLSQKNIPSQRGESATIKLNFSWNSFI
jgi:hypothetical protein